MSEDYGRVAVLMGGQSAERNISLITGQSVFDALSRKGVDAFTIDVNRDIANRLQETKPDFVFIALHGMGGEDGAIQGMLELMGIPYTGSGVTASAFTMDKILTKRVWRSVGVPTTDFLVLDEIEDPKEAIKQLGLPLCVKPIADGSSLGISRVVHESELNAAIIDAQQYHGGVMFEPWIKGRELTVGILGNMALPVIEIITKRDFYDYIAKYECDDNVYCRPEGIDEQTQHQLQDLALKAFQVTKCQAWGRVDMMFDENNQPWLMDLNTIPGMTPASLVPKAAKLAGIEFDDVILKILQESRAQKR